MNSELSITADVGKFAEEELRKFYRAAEISPSQLVITDSSGVIEYVNPSFCRITGYTEQEAIGKTPAILKSGRMPATFYGRLWDLLRIGSDWSGEFYNRRKDGTLFIERATITSIKGSDGNISHYIKISEDITEQRLHEDHQLRRMKLIEAINSANLDFIEKSNISRMSEIILETCMTVTSSPFAILYELLPSGGASVLSLSTAAPDPVSEVAGFKDIQYEIMRHGHYDVPLHKALFMAPVMENRIVVVNSPEENLWHECSCRMCSSTVTRFAGFPLRVGSDIIGMLGLANRDSGYSSGDIQDIEAVLPACSLALSAARAKNIRKSNQEQLRQTQKMEAIGQLANGIAHDFNNLLTVINGYSTLALQKAAGNEQIRKDIEQVLSAGERATTLIRQLLAFGRRQILDPKPVNVNTFIASIHKILCRLIGENITLTTQLDDKVGRVKADPTQIEQIIMNLVINARDALEKGGVITIETADRHLDAAFVLHNRGASEGNYVMISVRDSGMGMSEDIISRIFEPFFTTKEGTGTGLGLATVYGIVKQSGGYIQVLSEVGIGSEFRVYLPRLESSEAATPKTEHAARNIVHFGEEGLILIVEDEQTVLDLAAITLRSRGYDVLTASGPLDALKIFDHYGEKIDLLLTDVMMPDMSGPEMARKMRDLRPDLKLLFMSGYSDDKLDAAEFPDEQLRFMMKPFSPADLSRLVSDALAEPHKIPTEQFS